MLRRAHFRRRSTPGYCAILLRAASRFFSMMIRPAPAPILLLQWLRKKKWHPFGSFFPGRQATLLFHQPDDFWHAATATSSGQRSSDPQVFSDLPRYMQLGQHPQQVERVSKKLRKLARTRRQLLRAALSILPTSTRPALNACKPVRVSHHAKRLSYGARRL